MKRLKYYLLGMKPNDEKYDEMYEGAMYETFIDKDPIIHYHPVYWDEEIGYEISKSNRLEASKPTVTIHIPAKNFKFSSETMSILESMQKEDRTGTIQKDYVQTAVLDYVYRAFLPYIKELNEENDNRKRIAKENGHYYFYEPNSKILTRNVVRTQMVAQKYYTNPNKNNIMPIDGQEDVPNYLCVSIMIMVQLPVGKHKKAIQMLAKDLPDKVNRFLVEFNHAGLADALTLAGKQKEIREWLKNSDYYAFVANGSILPREKGTDQPMKRAVPFYSTKQDEIEIAGIKGMGFRKGVTVITGGGYSGKSTLLDAISEGIYGHIAGDGRELIITEDTAMKVSAEDGRSIRHCNLSPFIKWIPGGNPKDFSTDHASGSTSQAANIMEAVNWGCRLFMIDEDKSATNFMIQDSVMKALIEKEPITPFVERVQELAEKKQVSTMLVIGGSSEYLSVADRIYMMKDYAICEVTKEAKEFQRECSCRIENGVKVNHAEEVCREDFSKGSCMADWHNRTEVDANYLTTYPDESSTEVVKVLDLGFIILGDEQIDIRMMHNIASIPQLNAIAFLLRKLMNRINPMDRYQTYSLEKLSETQAPAKWVNLQHEVEQLLEEIQTDGLESTFSGFFTECSRWMDAPRKYEMLAILSRMRTHL